MKTNKKTIVCGAIALLCCISSIEIPVSAADAGIVIAQENNSRLDASFVAKAKPSAVVKKLQEAAARGYAPAQFELGLKLIDGMEVSQDMPKAIEWINRAAEVGHAPAQFFVGTMKDGVNEEESFAWNQKAAEQGYAAAQAKLGDFYRLGKYVRQDFAAAAQWYKKAADQKDLYAQFAMGVFYEHGIGVKQSAAWAANWYRRALRQTKEFSRESYFKNGTDWPLKAQYKALWYRTTLSEIARSAPEQFNTPQPGTVSVAPTSTGESVLTALSTDEAAIADAEASASKVTPTSQQEMPSFVLLPQNSSWVANRFQLALEHESGIALEERYGKRLPQNISSAQRSYLLGHLYFDEFDTNEKRFEAAQWRLRAVAQDGGDEIQHILVRNLMSDGTEIAYDLVNRMTALSASISDATQAGLTANASGKKAHLAVFKHVN